MNRLMARVIMLVSCIGVIMYAVMLKAVLDNPGLYEGFPVKLTVVFFIITIVGFCIGLIYTMREEK